MKILVISDAWLPQVNGVVRTYEYLNEELRKRGHIVEVIGPSDFSFCIPLPGYSEIKLALFPRKRLQQKMKDFAPDILHIATEGPLGWAGRACALKMNMVFTTAYHTQFPEYAAKRIKQIFPLLEKYVREKSITMMRKFHAPAKAILVASQSLEDQLKEWGFSAPMVRLVRGVNYDLFKPGPKTCFQDLQRPIALYVGRVAIEKSLHKFLDMNWPGSKVIIGHGPSLEFFQERYTDAHFIGKKEGEILAAHYQSADVFVFPSKTDTFGIVLIEALACGLPIAAYPVIGPKDIVTQPDLGCLDEDLETAAHKALENGNSKKCVDYVHTHYTWEIVADQFLESYS